MATSAAGFGVRRFGIYEFDPRNGELRKQGIRIRLEGQPLAILRMLLEHPGELLTREELQKQLWPADTFVDFDHGLNTAIKRLRTVLNDSANTPRYIETIASRGYRFIAPVERLDASGLVAGAKAKPQSAARGLPRGSPLIIGFVVLAVVLIAAVGGFRNLILPRGEIPQIHSLAVLPLQNLSGDPSQEYFSDGMTDALITDLAQMNQFRVISRTSIMRYKDTRARKSLQQIARELGVDAIVEGTVVRSGSRIRITSQLIYAPSDQHLWARSYERDVGDLIALQGEVAQAIAGGVRATLSPNERKRLVAQATTNPAAYDAFLKGRHYWNQRTPVGIRKSIESYEEAVKQDPNFAPAYAGLADAYNFSNILGVLAPKDSFPQAKAAATRALQLNPDLAEAHAALGLVESHYDFDFSGAQKEFLRALELNPNYANAHLFYSGGYFSAMGQHENAIAEMKKALELDPLSPGLNNYMGIAYMLAGNYAESRRQFERTIALDPTFPFVHFSFAGLLEETEDYESAIAEREKAELLVGASPNEAASMAAKSQKALKNGVNAYWHLQLERTLEAYKESKSDYFPAIEVAAAYARVDDKENAFKWLQKSCEAREGQSITLLSWLPAFKNLHGDPRFKDLLQRIGLPLK